MTRVASHLFLATMKWLFLQVFITYGNASAFTFSILTCFYSLLGKRSSIHVEELSVLSFLASYPTTSTHPIRKPLYALGLSSHPPPPSPPPSLLTPSPSLLAAPPGRLIDSVPGGGDHATFLIWLPLLQIKATSLHLSTPLFSSSQSPSVFPFFVCF